MIYLYLAFNKKADYRRSWTNIAYTVLTLGLNEEENFCIFAHLLENVLSVFTSHFLTIFKFKGFLPYLEKLSKET